MILNVILNYEFLVENDDDMELGSLAGDISMKESDNNQATSHVVAAMSPPNENIHSLLERQMLPGMLQNLHFWRIHVIQSCYLFINL